MVLWDRRRWYPDGDAGQDYKRGYIKFRLQGEKLRGGFALIKMHGRRSDDGDNWLLVRKECEYAKGDGEYLVRERRESGELGRTNEEMTTDPNNRVWHSKAAKKSAPRTASREKTPGRACAGFIGERGTPACFRLRGRSRRGLVRARLQV